MVPNKTQFLSMLSATVPSFYLGFWIFVLLLSGATYQQAHTHAQLFMVFFSIANIALGIFWFRSARKKIKR